MSDKIEPFKDGDEAEHAEISDPCALLDSLEVTEPKAYRWMQRALVTIRALETKVAQKKAEIVYLRATHGRWFASGLERESQLSKALDEVTPRDTFDTVRIVRTSDAPEVIRKLAAECSRLRASLASAEDFGEIATEASGVDNARWKAALTEISRLRAALAKAPCQGTQLVPDYNAPFGTMKVEPLSSGNCRTCEPCLARAAQAKESNAHG